MDTFLPRVATAAATLLAVTALAGCGSSGGSASASSSSSSSSSSASSGAGSGAGSTTAELTVASSCTGQCATLWQVTLDGHPLHLFSRDSDPGDVLGQGIGSVWYAVGPDGSMLTGGGTRGGY